MYRLDVSFYDKAMGHNSIEENLELINDMIDTEDAFERLMEHAVRSVRLANEAEEILASLIGAWQCVTRARVAAGF